MKRKRILTLFVSMLCLSILLSCTGPKQEPQPDSGNAPLQKHEKMFYDTFDTIINIVFYTETQEEFDKYYEMAYQEYKRLHQLYDNYSAYDGINNVYTINQNAGIRPVKVEPDLIDLIEFSKEWYDQSEHKMDVTLGSVLAIWHKYREEGLANPSAAKLPSMEELQEAKKHIGWDNVEINRESSTVFLKEPQVQLDLGAVAKGYATEYVAEYVAGKGLKSGIISAGGNIRTIGVPMDGTRSKWGIGVQNPDVESKDTVVETLFIGEMSVVTSGDYQRAYEVEGKKYHHIIDPNTLMPSNEFRSVSIMTLDSGVADALSTTLFLMPLEEGKRYIEHMDGVDALWILPDGSFDMTQGMEAVMKSRGATSK